VFVNTKILLAGGLLAISGFSAACSGTATNANQTANVNANTPGPVVQSTDNPTTVPGNVPTGGDPTQGAKPAPNTHPGPDNSDIEVVMDKNGDVVETRTFKNNKNVSKVVVVTTAKNGKMTKTVTVYDGNGKPHAAPESKAESVMQELGDDVARGAGIVVQKTKDVAGDTKNVAGKVVDAGADATRKTVDKTKEGLNKAKEKLP
jgi:hypothetical protein